MTGPALFFALALVQAGPAAATSAPPHSLDARLVFEQIAREPVIVTPTGLAVDARGRVFVIESHTHFRPKDYKGPPADRVRIFEDVDGDGRFERVGTFFEGTRFTMNLAFARDGTLFLATRYALYRLWDRDGDGKADGEAASRVPRPIVRLDTPGDYPHNGLSGFAFDAAGNVYFGLGENLGASYRLKGNDGTTLTGGGEGGNIYRCRPDGTKLVRIATGFWNPFHVAFDAFGNLFAVDNDPDSRPPCRLLHIVEGGDYGYRFRNGRKGLHPFTAWNGELPGTLPMVAGTGEAPCGVLAYEASNLPEDYRGTLLVTSWGDYRIEKYRLQPRGASFRSMMEPVVVGGDDFRPVGISCAPDGSLFFSDWVDKSYELHGKGRVWRLRKRSSAPVKSSVSVVHRPASDESPVAQAEALRRTADPAARGKLLKALESDDPFLQQAARMGLKQSLPFSDIKKLADDPEPAHRIGALLILRESGKPEVRSLVPRFLDDPDPTIRFAAIQWVGEERLAKHRPRLMRELAAGKTTRQVFEGTLAALEMLDARKRAPSEEVSGEEYIAALLKDSQTSPAVIRRGLRMLRPDHPVLTVSLLQEFLDAPDPAIRLEAIRTLGSGSLPGRFEILSKIANDGHESESLRAWARLGLAERNAGSPATASAAKTDPSRPPVQDLDAWLKKLEGKADAAEGERIFYHPRGPGCYRCHQVDGRGGRAGPDLTRLAKGMDRRRLVQSILQPSLEIAPQFVAWSVARTDGTVFSGVLLGESSEGMLMFADGDGKRIDVKPSEIDERKPQPTSIMPDNVTQTLSPREFRDLLAFLLAGRAD
ncbi:MAG: PVC-type heme-binding CxxCH protein [Isosphaeraceae bacterium]